MCPVPEMQLSQHGSWICNFADTEVSNLPATWCALGLSRWAPPSCSSSGRALARERAWKHGTLTGLMLFIDSRFASLSICRMFPPGPSEDVGRGSHFLWVTALLVCGARFCLDSIMTLIKCFSKSWACPPWSQKDTHRQHHMRASCDPNSV